MPHLTQFSQSRQPHFASALHVAHHRAHVAQRTQCVSIPVAVLQLAGQAEAALQRIPLGRLGESHEIASVAAFLVSSDASAHSDGDIQRILAAMVGTISQRPSSVSAVKVDGERAYDRVRAGEVFELAARTVTISSLEVLNIRHLETTTEVDIDVTCSAGTFIRAIARDLGDELKVGGHLRALRRTRVAGFALDVATSIEALKGKNFTALHLTDVARRTFEARELTVEEVRELSFGRPLSPSANDGIVAGISGENELIALLKNESDKAKPVAVFAAAH
jgi:tRNA pseudouridine55 synthase